MKILFASLVVLKQINEDETNNEENVHKTEKKDQIFFFY